MLNSLVDQSDDTPEKQREREVEVACDIIDVIAGVGGPDNKAAGTVTYGRYGPVRTYAQSGVIYASTTEAVILKSSLLPSSYYGRRPLANYIRKGRKIGISIVRGFDQAEWDKLYPSKQGPKQTKAYEGVSTSQAGAPPDKRQKSDPELAQSLRPKVTDLILVVHGIGQKLSERMESYHFTHAMNAFRREVNVELGTDAVKVQLDRDAGGIMVLPVGHVLCSCSFGTHLILGKLASKSVVRGRWLSRREPGRGTERVHAQRYHAGYFTICAWYCFRCHARYSVLSLSPSTEDDCCCHQGSQSNISTLVSEQSWLR